MHYRTWSVCSPSSFHRYQIIQLDNRGDGVWETCLRFLRNGATAGSRTHASTRTTVDALPARPSRHMCTRGLTELWGRECKQLSYYLCDLAHLSSRLKPSINNWIFRWSNSLTRDSIDNTHIHIRPNYIIKVQPPGIIWGADCWKSTDAIEYRRNWNHWKTSRYFRYSAWKVNQILIRSKETDFQKCCFS